MECTICYDSFHNFPVNTCIQQRCNKLICVKCCSKLKNKCPFCRSTRDLKRGFKRYGQYLKCKDCFEIILGTKKSVEQHLQSKEHIDSFLSPRNPCDEKEYQHPQFNRTQEGHFKCKGCSTILKRASSLDRHLKSKKHKESADIHSVSRSSLIPPSVYNNFTETQGGHYKCKRCSSVLKRVSSLAKHLTSKKHRKSFDSASVSQSSVSQSSVYNNFTDLTETQGHYKCKRCSSILKRMSSLAKHLTSNKHRQSSTIV